MDSKRLTRITDTTWRIEPVDNMRVPAVIYATEDLITAMDEKVYEQAANVTMLPGIVDAAYIMPDAHWGYGFPIGGVAAFDPNRGGVISAGGVGFDISCGVRTLHTGLVRDDIEPVKVQLADMLYEHIPAGMGSTGNIHFDDRQMDAMLTGGAQWAVQNGYGLTDDLEYIEEHGCVRDALPAKVSQRARKRQQNEMGTLGSGNHYLEVQEVTAIYDPNTADVFKLNQGDLVISIHCGSRGLGHQIGTEFLKEMAMGAANYGIHLPDRELACAPVYSRIGKDYLKAMRAAINCALANRQIITHLTRLVFQQLFPNRQLDLLYDVSHNTCKLEEHFVNEHKQHLYVHRKGATRALGAGHPDLPAAYQQVGQPVLIGGSMGTASYILAGNPGSEKLSFASACHGAGRCMSRRKAFRSWNGRQIIEILAERGIIIRSPSYRGVAEEAPAAYKNVDTVVDAADKTGLARKVARLEPVICIKG